MLPKKKQSCGQHTVVQKKRNALFIISRAIWAKYLERNEFMKVNTLRQLSDSESDKTLLCKVLTLFHIVFSSSSFSWCEKPLCRMKVPFRLMYVSLFCKKKIQKILNTNEAESYEKYIQNHTQFTQFNKLNHFECSIDEIRCFVRKIESHSAQI